MGTGRGKIGRMPAEARERINGMIRDNRPAEEIIAACEELGVSGVTPSNVSSWKRWGYQRWASRMDRLEAMAQRRAFAASLVQEAGEGGADGLQMASDAASALAVDAIAEALEEFDSGALAGMLAERPDRFVALVDALSGIRGKDQSGARLRQQLRKGLEKAEEAVEQGAVATREDLRKIMRDVYGLAS